MKTFRLFCLGAFLACCSSVCFGEGWLGMKVLPIENGDPIKAGGQVIGDLADFDWPRTVEKEDGNLVWLADSKIEGWVEKKSLETVDDSLKRYEKLVREDPNFENYTGRGNAWWCKDEFDKAIKDYSESLRLAEDDANKGVAYWNLGSALLKKGDAQAAIDDLTKGIRLSGKTPTRQFECYKLRAEAYDKLDNKEAAARDRRIMEQIKKTIPK